jgi:poly(A) polymerase
VKVITPEEHQIDPSLVSPAAIAVVRQLRNAQYQAYIVGGAVRDLLLKQRPKDFDVATNATPEQVRSLFRGARIIGRRFQIVHVRHGRDIIEVTTFRGHHDDEDNKQSSHQSHKGLLLRDNVYGSLEDDAVRRDLTINALYYDPDTHTILDQTGGLQDIVSKEIRVIGDPRKRYREDPVRMLRVLRFAARLQFGLTQSTAEAIDHCAALLSEIPAARLFDECLKLFMSGHGAPTLALLHQHKLLAPLFPESASLLAHDAKSFSLVAAAMANTDHRVHIGKPVTPAFLLGVLLWPTVRRRFDTLCQAGEHPHEALHSAGQQIIAETIAHVAIPKRFSLPMREIWNLQLKLERMPPKKVKDIIANRRFRAAYDLLLLRDEHEQPFGRCVAFWTEQQQLFPDLVGSAPDTLAAGKPRQRRRRRTP